MALLGTGMIARREVPATHSVALGVLYHVVSFGVSLVTTTTLAGTWMAASQRCPTRIWTLV